MKPTKVVRVRGSVLLRINWLWRPNFLAKRQSKKSFGGLLGQHAVNPPKVRLGPYALDQSDPLTRHAETQQVLLTMLAEIEIQIPGVVGIAGLHCVDFLLYFRQGDDLDSTRNR